MKRGPVRAQTRSAAFVASNDLWDAFQRRSLHSGLRWHFSCDKKRTFKFAPKGQA
jgi:hypothetical protein